MLINHVMFWMMIVEGIVCVLISLPYGKHIAQRIIQFLSTHLGGKDSIAASIMNVVLALVTILFLSNVHTCYKYLSSDTMLSDGLRIRLLMSQRDMYISGFCLFLFLLLRLVYSSIETNIRLEKSLNAMKKQAEGASNGYKKLLEENEILEKQVKKIQQLVGFENGENDDRDEKSKKNILSKLVEENAQLTIELDTLKNKLKNAETKVDVVKKQATSQSDSFMQLLEEKNKLTEQVDLFKEKEKEFKELEQKVKQLEQDKESLKNQIQDYDFMFTDAKKKAE